MLSREFDGLIFRGISASDFRGISPCASVGSKNVGEELVFTSYLDNQVDGKLSVGFINGAHYTGGDHQLLAC